MKVRELYNQSVFRLRQIDIPDAALEAELLLRFFLELDRVSFFLDDRELPLSDLRRFDNLLTRRLAREPLSYIIGEHEFWSLPFEVSPDVLIPRPETEILIEKVLALIEEPAFFRGEVLELGVGSGIISIVLALELPGLEILSVDLSTKALGVAARNVERHGVARQVSLVKGDWFSPLSPGAEFDFIVSNPPYVAGHLRGVLQPELGFEPDLALYGGEEGMMAYQLLIPLCRQYLKAGGYVLFEIGSDQEEAIRKLFMVTPGFTEIEIVKDRAGLPRVALAKAVDVASGRM